MRRLQANELTGVEGVTPKDVEMIIRFSGGSRAIAEALIRLIESDLPRKEQMVDAGRVAAEVLTRTLKELSPELLGWLQRWVFERNMLRVSLSDVNNAALQELRSAAVAEIDPADDRIELFPPPHTARWRKALDTALSDLVEAPPQCRSAVADLFFIERNLRRAISSMLEVRYGTKWATRLPADMQERIIEVFSAIFS